LIFTSHDYTIMNTVANRIIEITPNGIIDQLMTFDEYIKNERIKQKRDALYGTLKTA
jgi:ATPase subunit of ABC transporter with duplicated ATPase domains